QEPSRWSTASLEVKQCLRSRSADEIAQRRQFPTRLRQPHPMSGSQAREVAGAVVNWHAIGDEDVRLAFGFEFEDPFTGLVVALPAGQQRIGQCRVLSEDASVDRGEPLRHFLVPTFL